MTEREKQIVHIEEEMAEAFNRKNIEKIVSFFDGDFNGFSSTRHERIRDLDALRKTFEHYLEEGDSVQYAISDVSVQFPGEIAIASFYWVVTIKSETRARQIPGRGTHVFHREHTDWRIIHEHFSRSHHQ